jgi:hypothetical protein
MSIALTAYKELIDGLVEVRDGVEARRVHKGVWLPEAGNEDINRLLAGLTDDQKKTLARMLQESRDGGIHDTLAYLTEQMSLRGLRLFKGATEIKIPDFSGQMHFDWVSRRAGDIWPDER